MSGRRILPRNFEFYGNGQENKSSWKRGNKIGCGAYSKVFKATIELPDKTLTIAAKQISFPNKENEKHKLSAVAEIKALKRLDHERIVVYFGFLELEYKSFIFMEYIEEGSLRTYLNKLKTNEALETGQVKHFARQLLQGLEYLHGEKCIHRDLKPDNILIQGGNIKLADFGLSKFFDGICKTYGSFMGTTRYMAPELFDCKSHSFSVDVWSFGCNVLEMATGVMPFPEIEDRHLTRLMCNNSVIPIDKQYRNAKLTRDVEMFLSQIFILDANRRPEATVLLNDTFLNESQDTGEVGLNVINHSHLTSVSLLSTDTSLKEAATQTSNYVEVKQGESTNISVKYREQPSTSTFKVLRNKNESFELQETKKKRKPSSKPLK